MEKQHLTHALPAIADHTFVALPSDPTTPLTPEQLDSLFAGEHRDDALRDLLRLLADTSLHLPAREGVAS